MMRNGDKKNTWIPLAIYGALAFLSLLVLIPVSPYFQPVPAVDSSVFLYTGDRILEGAVPYRDVWDHKGPLIYYLNAAGLGLAAGSRWGVWLIELLFVISAAWLANRTMDEMFGRWLSFFASLLFLSALMVVLHGGNMAEEYALPFQFLCVLLFVLSSKYKSWNFPFLLGVVAALCFLLRPNIVGIPLAIIIVHILSATKEPEYWKRLGWMCLGGLTTVGLVAVYFFANNALADLWNAVFRYNLAYIFLRYGQRVSAVFTGIQLLPVISIFGFLGFLAAVRLLRSRKDSDGLVPLLQVLLVALPLEILLTSLPSREYKHYFMSWLPVFTLLSGFFLYRLFSFDTVSSRRVRVLGSSLVVLALAFSWYPGLDLLGKFSSLVNSAWHVKGLPLIDYSENPYQPTLTYVLDHTQPQDTILFWGNNLAVQWLSDRNAPTRYAYQSAFAVPGFADQTMVSELINDLKADPGLIFDTTIQNDPVPAIDVDINSVPSILLPLYEYLQQNYRFERTLLGTRWIVYEYVGSDLAK